MSIPPISTRELEQLSAYLDGELDKQAVAQLQRDLAQRPDLQRALEELRQTRAMLRNAPRRRVPHNFTLKPQMVPARRRVFSRPVFSLGLASALATFFLLLSVMLEFVPTPSMLSAPAAPQSMETGSGRNQAQATPKTFEASKTAVSGPAEALPTAAPTTALKSVEATKVVSQPVTAATPTPPDQMRITGDLQPQGTALPTRPASPTLMPTDLPAPQPTEPQMMLGVPPAAATETPVVQDAALPRGEQGRTLTWLQTLLVVLALGTGLAALYLRRRR